MTFKQKINKLNEDMDILIEILPGSAEIDFHNRTILNTYFEPDSEDERVEMINYIVKHINSIRINFQNIVSMVYSQMESFLGYTLKCINKESDYETYSKGRKGSILQKKLDFIISECGYTLTSSDNILITGINDPLRNARNDMMHNIYEVYSFIEAEKFVADGKNLDRKIEQLQYDYIAAVNSLDVILESFFALCNKVCPVS